jgi:NAD(P)-dependent dehydrogenase (short-subunit alcohol dehydrogenase family)
MKNLYRDPGAKVAAEEAMAETWGRIAVVTGGASGVGRAIAASLAKRGAAVAIADRDEAAAIRVADGITATGDRAIGLGCDVTDPGSVAILKAEVDRRLGPATLVVANAGPARFERLMSMSDEAVDGIVQDNLLGVLAALKAFLPDMMELREGHVVGASSSSALLAPYVKSDPIHVAAKCAVLGLMFSLRAQLREFGIGATALCTGQASGPLTDAGRYLLQRHGLHDDGPAVDRLLESSPRQRAEEVGEMVLNAIRADLPVVVADSSQRELFDHGFVRLVRSGFDVTDAFDAARVAAPGAAA